MRLTNKYDKYFPPRLTSIHKHSKHWRVCIFRSVNTIFERISNFSHQNVIFNVRNTSDTGNTNFVSTYRLSLVRSSVTNRVVVQLYALRDALNATLAVQLTIPGRRSSICGILEQNKQFLAVQVHRSWCKIVRIARHAPRSVVSDLSEANVWVKESNQLRKTGLSRSLAAARASGWGEEATNVCLSATSDRLFYSVSWLVRFIVFECNLGAVHKRCFSWECSGCGAFCAINTTYRHIHTYTRKVYDSFVPYSNRQALSRCRRRMPPWWIFSSHGKMRF